MVLIKSVVNALPSSVIRFTGQRYVAGRSMQEGVDNICRLYDVFGYYSTFDRLGEDAATVDEANQTVDDYVRAVHLIGKRFGKFSNHPHDKIVSVSVKPSSICCVREVDGKIVFDEQTPLVGQLERITSEATKYGIDVTLDMESHLYTDQTIKAELQLWSVGNYNLGGVRQASLDRTREDIAKLAQAMKDGTISPEMLLRMRLCRGIYTEPKEIAVGRKDAKLRLIDRVAEFSAAGGYVEIATHDKRIIDKIITGSLAFFDSKMREFQFLLGPPVAEKYLAPRLYAEGEVVRFYMAAEFESGHGDPYVRRRLIESPLMILQGGTAFAFGGSSLTKKAKKLEERLAA